jgi:hypothetical protein
VSQFQLHTCVGKRECEEPTCLLVTMNALHMDIPRF